MSERRPIGKLAVSQVLGRENVTLTRNYDLVLAGLSWEKRSTAAFRRIEKLGNHIELLKFSSRTKEIEKKKSENLAEFKKLAAKCKVIKLAPSTSFPKNAETIEGLITDTYAKLKRPLRVLVDITCIPKSYTLFVLGLGFSRHYFARLDCVYAEGIYSLADLKNDALASDDSQSGIISEGEWEALQIPYLEAEHAIPASRDLVVSMGGEIGLSLPFIERYEPRNLGLMLISESLVQTPDKLADSERVALEGLLAEPNVSRHNIGLCDVLSLSRKAIELSQASKAETVTGVAIGAKPHALALGLAALSEENFELICRIPKRYKQLDVDAKGSIAFYEIEDRFEPSAYF